MEDEEDQPPTTTTTTATAVTTTTSMITLLLILLLSLPSTTFAATKTASGGDASIMSTLSKSLKSPPQGWSDPNPCAWQGVECDNAGHVTSISLATKSLSGTLPDELKNLPSLKSVSLQNNNLFGPVPAFANMPNLQELFLDGNAFTKVSPPFLAGLSSLQSFSIDDNPLAPWSLPSNLSDSSSLQELRASNASLVGSIPDIFGSLPSLKDVRLSYNNLTGPLPPSFAGSSIQNLWINNQRQGLSGTLDVLGKMTSLSQVWVHDNAFVGPIPDLKNCSSLFDLQLRDNHLTGVVPPTLRDLPKLVNISLQNNMLLGPVPIFNKGVQVTLGNTNSFCNPTPGPCDPQVTTLLAIAGAFGYPEELAESWKGNDACKNWDRVTCDSSGKVTSINFAKQGWTGTISPAFANLISLTSIILNDNKIVGTIPQELTTLKMLKILDVSNNNLTGKVPDFDNVKVNTNGNNFVGTNVDTSSSIKSPPGANNSPLRPKSSSAESASSSSGLSASKIGGIIVGIIALLILVGFIVYVVVKKKKAKKYGAVKSSKKGKSKVEDLKMSPIESSGGSPTEKSTMINNAHTFYDHGNVIAIDVLREVTNNFSENNILGKGGFGVVYKGMLNDGTPIAVKRMESNLQGTKGMSEFEAEIAVLSKVRHRHLVALLGYCVTGRERIVVYEYMPQGTLGQHIFNYKEMGVSPLTWKQRIVIALDVARGVEYLHSLAQQSFIHRDLKPSNILLGDDMRAKVSDFGLVKNAPDKGKYSVETRLAGTFGYLAPEYAATGRVTTKVDVFAFGVVLMELITARKALDESLPDDQAQLVTWFRRVLISKDSLRKALDPNLESDDEEIFDSICKVAELSGYCTIREPQQRPDMSHAVSVLSPLVEQWRPTETDGGDDGVGIDVNMSLPQALQRWQAGETTTMSDYSRTQNYNSGSTAPTTPGVNDSFNNIQGR